MSVRRPIFRWDTQFATPNTGTDRIEKSTTKHQSNNKTTSLQMIKTRIAQIFAALILAAPIPAVAATIDFTTANANSVSSVAGEDFAYTVGATA